MHLCQSVSKTVYKQAAVSRCYVIGNVKVMKEVKQKKKKFLNSKLLRVWQSANILFYYFTLNHFNEQT